MYWEKCDILTFSRGATCLVKISGKEKNIGENIFYVYITEKAYEELVDGLPIRKALKDYPYEIKEFLMSGLAPHHPIKKTLERPAYITNAVANSVVFYAMAYLNNNGLTPTEIKTMREKYSFSNLDDCLFNRDELKLSFIKQSAFFLNLYKEMMENDRFADFAENLEKQNRFKEVFRNYEDSLMLNNQFKRRIFHDKLECPYMRSDYNEDTVFFANTGVFTEEELLHNQKYYIVNTDYLKEMGMRICKGCEGRP